MPELPEVQTVADGLCATILNREIAEQRILPHRMVRTAIPDELTPFSVTGIHRFGKYLRLDTDRGWRIVLHLGMTGKITVTEGGDPAPRHLRLYWRFADGGDLFFADPRGFGRIAFHAPGAVIPEEAAMGIDPLSPEFGPGVLGKLLRLRRAPVKTLLLDQSLVAGIGNIYACEALFRAGVHPAIPGGDLSRNQVGRLARAIVGVLSEAVAANGTSISDFRRVDDKTGEFQNFLQIYAKKSCLCGGPVVRIIQANRSTWFCPACQKEGKRRTQTPLP